MSKTTRVMIALFACSLVPAITAPGLAGDKYADNLAGRPPIGSSAYSRGCELRHAWEDGSAVAYCPEDGATYTYDPDGRVQVAGGVMMRPVGWYVGNDWEVN